MNKYVFPQHQGILLRAANRALKQGWSLPNNLWELIKHVEKYGELEPKDIDTVRALLSTGYLTSEQYNEVMHA